MFFVAPTRVPIFQSLTVLTPITPAVHAQHLCDTVQRNVAEHMAELGVDQATQLKILKLHYAAASAYVPWYHVLDFNSAMRQIHALSQPVCVCEACAHVVVVDPVAYAYILQRPAASWALHAIPVTTFAKYTSNDSESTNARRA